MPSATVGVFANHKIDLFLILNTFSSPLKIFTRRYQTNVRYFSYLQWTILNICWKLLM